MSAARELTAALKGKWHGKYGLAGCPAHPDKTPSLSISERNGKVLFKCHAGCSQAAVLSALVNLDAWPKREGGAECSAPARKIEEPPKQGNEGLAPKWQAFWNRCHPITADSPAGRYLIGRCCAMPPNDVRWHPEAWHPHEKQMMPAIVALITDVYTIAPISLHFTFIKPDGSGKAEIERPRLYLAGHRKTGGVVRIDPDDAVSMGLIIGEGLETCLSYRLQFAPVWACLDAGNLAQFPVLPGIEGITVLVDMDPAGEDAFAKVRARYRDAGLPGTTTATCASIG